MDQIRTAEPAATGFLVELGRDALVERHGPGRLAYGRWDTVFGAWKISGNGAGVPILPRFPLFDRLGRPIGPPDAPSNEDLQDAEIDEWYFGTDLSRERTDHQPTLEREAYDAYARLVPERERAIAGPMARPANQWLVLAALRADDMLAPMLERELDTVGGGFVEACLILSGFRALIGRDIAHFLNGTLTQPRHAVLGRLAGLAVSRSTARLVHKYVSFENADAADIRKLLEAGGRAAEGRMLRRRRYLHDCFVDLVAHIPPEFEHARWLRLNSVLPWPLRDFLLPCLERAKLIRARLAAVDAHSPKGRLAAAHTAIARSRSPEHMHLLLAEIDASVEPSVWPEAPWPGSTDFTRVCGLKALKMIAKAFRNCALTRLTDYADGAAFLYVAYSPQTVLIEIRRAEDGRGWHIADAESLGRTRADARTVRRFVRAFTRATGTPIRGQPDAGAQAG
jgi:hypothetical protein